MAPADPTSHAQSDPHVGRWLKDKWRLDAVLGSGGIGTVYAATHRNLGRAAIKVLHGELAQRPSLVSRFLLEGYAANAVGHPGAVQVLDDDATEDGLVYLVMELLEGETLDARARANGGRLPVAEVLMAIGQVLSVIESAHAKGIVHRDLKPENVFVCGDGEIKVLDFGLARVLEATTAATTAKPRLRTQQGWMMGTPGYMPPEQVRGLWDKVDGRSDIWAIGAMLFSLLTGRLVHEGEDNEVDIFATATAPPPSLAEVAPGTPASVVALVDRALAMLPDDRWESAASMRSAIVAIVGETSSAVSPRSSRAMGSVRRAPRVVDNTSPVEIAPGTYWVGKRDPKGIFHSNPYLRVFPSASGEPYNLLVDPGSSSDFSVVSAKVGSVIGGMGALSGLFINHQDPDVGSSASMICGRYAPHAAIHCSEATWRLIVHLNLPADRFVDTDSRGRGIVLPTGHRVVPVPSPFCHFRGAVMLYDPETRTLFSGDLLGGISASGAHDIWADESDWSGVRAFHQAFMPTNRALAWAVRAIRKLSPFPEIIAPQHGRILRGSTLLHFLDRLEHLPVGLDVMDDAGDGADAMAAWSSVLNRVLHTARIVLGSSPEQVVAESEELQECCRRSGGRFEVTAAGRWTIGTVVRILTAGRTPTLANPIRLEAIFACEELELPSPDVLLAGERHVVSVA